MKYFLFDQTTGDIAHFVDTPDVHTESYVEGLEIISADNFSPGDEARYKVFDGNIVLKVLPPSYATQGQIREKRDALELQPILVAGVTIDCDTKSEMRMRDCLAAWDSLPILAGQFEDVGGVRRVFWVLADNTKVGLSKSELEYIYSSMLQLRAARGAVIFSKYQELKVRGDVTQSELDLWVV